MENANDDHEALRFEKYGPPSVFSLQEPPGCHTNWAQAALDATIDEIISGGRVEHGESGCGLLKSDALIHISRRLDAFRDDMVLLPSQGIEAQHERVGISAEFPLFFLSCYCALQWLRSLRSPFESEFRPDCRERLYQMVDILCGMLR